MIPEGLNTKGYVVDILPVYETVTAEPDPSDLERVRSGDFDVVTFTSSSTVENFCRLVGPSGCAGHLDRPDHVRDGGRRRLASRRGGRSHDIDGLVAAVLALLGR